MSVKARSTEMPKPKHWRHPNRLNTSWPMDDNANTRVIREKIIEQQRADSLLKFIITKLETKNAVKAGLIISPPLPKSNQEEQKQDMVDEHVHDEKHQSGVAADMLDDEE